MTHKQLAARLPRIPAAPLALGPIHPGSLSTQYNVCGTPGCQGKDPRHPQKHGPYHQLSYTWRGKSTTRFVRPGLVLAGPLLQDIAIKLVGQVYIPPNILTPPPRAQVRLELRHRLNPFPRPRPAPLP